MMIEEKEVLSEEVLKAVNKYAYIFQKTREIREDIAVNRIMIRSIVVDMHLSIERKLSLLVASKIYRKPNDLGWVEKFLKEKRRGKEAQKLIKNLEDAKTDLQKIDYWINEKAKLSFYNKFELVDFNRREKFLRGFIEKINKVRITLVHLKSGEVKYGKYVLMKSDNIKFLDKDFRKAGKQLSRKVSRFVAQNFLR